jgi:predicted transcriptional regulator
METKILADLIIHLKKNSITQNDLADAAGVDKSFISRAIMGKKKFTDARIQKIRNRFPKIPPAFFRNAA